MARIRKIEVTKPKKTSIQVTEDTRDKLKALGNKGETYDDIIRRLIAK